MYSAYLFFKKALAVFLSVIYFIFPFFAEKYNPAPGQALPDRGCKLSSDRSRPSRCAAVKLLLPNE